MTLADRLADRQEAAVRHADAATVAVDLLIHQHWRRMVQAMGTGPPHVAGRDVGQEYRAMAQAVQAETHARLIRLALWGHQEARADLTAVAAAHGPAPVREDTLGIDNDTALAVALGAAALALLARLGLRRLSWRQIAAYLWPPLAPAAAAAIVGRRWEPRLAVAAAQSATVGLNVTTARTRGESPRQVAAAVVPLVDTLRNVVGRLFRTEAIRLVGATQRMAEEAVSNQIAGWMVHAILDSRTRPAHRARHGTRYYKRPKPGQLGLWAMPHPPYEADGSLAYNCRCILIPVLT